VLAFYLNRKEVRSLGIWNDLRDADTPTDLYVEYKGRDEEEYFSAQAWDFDDDFVAIDTGDKVVVIPTAHIEQVRFYPTYEDQG
jgi:hypothetical protein